MKPIFYWQLVTLKTLSMWSIYNGGKCPSIPVGLDFDFVNLTLLQYICAALNLSQSRRSTSWGSSRALASFSNVVQLHRRKKILSKLSSSNRCRSRSNVRCVPCTVDQPNKPLLSSFRFRTLCLEFQFIFWVNFCRF